jgi:hypothetical protein
VTRSLAEGAAGWQFNVDVPRRCPEGGSQPLCADGRQPSVPAEAQYRLDVLSVITQKVVWRHDLQAPSTQGSVDFIVPAGVLNAGQYQLKIYGTAQTEPVREYRVDIR